MKFAELHSEAFAARVGLFEEVKTGSLLSGKCTTGKSIGAQKYKNTGKVNGKKAMLLRDTGADQTL